MSGKEKIMADFKDMSNSFDSMRDSDLRSGLTPRVCETTGFISAVGGCGTSSAALALCRIYSSLFEYKTLYLSLDYLASKAFVRPGSVHLGTHLQCREAVYSLLFENQSTEGKLIRDDFGVFCFPSDKYRNSLHFLAEEQFYRLIDILENCFDRIVIDIPLNCHLSACASELCDSLVVCMGWQEERMALGKELYSFLKDSREGVISFAPGFEEGDPGDIYGRFGVEVRSLAETIEGR